VAVTYLQNEAERLYPLPSRWETKIEPVEVGPTGSKLFLDQVSRRYSTLKSVCMPSWKWSTVLPASPGAIRQASL